MKNKLVVSALVLGFSFAPISAFADYTTTQGGTPQYSCPQGSELVDTDKCFTPEVINNEEIVSSPTQTTFYKYYKCLTNSTLFAPESGYVLDACTVVSTTPLSQIAYRWNMNGQNYTIPTYGEWQLTTFDEAYCSPSQGTLVNNSCIKSVSETIPASTSPAVISGSNGGSLVASVSGFLTPVWNFLTEKLLPAIALLVMLGIGVRLSIKAVRKYSKVA